MTQEEEPAKESSLMEEFLDAMDLARHDLIRFGKTLEGYNHLRDLDSDV
ncbi:hypothetical protein ACFLUU_02290 [Chloroflexota bacterium]